MSIFSGVTSITIPEGNVTSITSNGVLLWKKYTNLINLATTDPDGTELYGGVGYKEGYRWSSSSGGETGGTGYARLTGWMPYTQGGLLRLKYFGFDRKNNGYGGYASGGYLVLRKQDGTYATKTLGWQDTDYVERELSDTGITHFRISGYCSPNYQTTVLLNPPIVTINEQINW